MPAPAPAPVRAAADGATAASAKEKRRRPKRGKAKAQQQQQLLHDGDDDHEDEDEDADDDDDAEKRARAADAPDEQEEPEEDDPPWGSKQPKPADADVVSYLLTSGGELARRKREGKEDDEETAVVRAAVFREIRKGEASLALEKRGARALEALVKVSTGAQLRGVFGRLKPYVGFLIYDPCGSRVVQTIAETVGAFPARHESSLELLRELVDNASKVDEWWAMMHDANATHVARALVRVLAERGEEADADALQRVGDVVMRGEETDVRNALRNPYAGGFLAVLVEATMPEPCPGLARRLFGVDFAGFEANATQKVGSHVLEAAVPRLSPEEKQMLWRDRVQPELLKWSRHRNANLVVQRVLDTLASADDVRVAVDTLVPHIETLLQWSRYGVLARLGAACARVRALELQRRFVVALVQASGGQANGVAVRRLLGLAGAAAAATTTTTTTTTTHEEQEPTSADDTTHPTTFAGPALVKCLLEELDPTALEPLLLSVTAMDADSLVDASTHTAATARAVEALFAPRGDAGALAALKPAKRAVFKTLRGRWADVACHYIGSHVAEHAFDGAPSDPAAKELAEELVRAKDRLRGAGRFGAKLAEKLKLDLLRRDEASWSAWFKKRAKRSHDLAAFVQEMS